MTEGLDELLSDYQSRNPNENDVVGRFVEFVRSGEPLRGKVNLQRHVTASSWIIDPRRTHVLLTHHVKLGIWVQLGGHTEVDEDWSEAALREAREESGLQRLRLLDGRLFDVDIHPIPARGREHDPGYVPAHFHYDLRFLVEADPLEPLIVSEESHDLRWVPVDRLGDWTTDESQHRMAAKVRLRWASREG